MNLNKRDLIRSVCRESYYEFIREFWGTIIPEKPIWNWHIEFLCNEIQIVLERVFRGEVKAYDMVANCPPGTSKSTIFSVMPVAWAWTRMISCRFLCISYAYTLAMDLSRKSRDVIKSEKYQYCFPEVKIRDDQDSKQHFVNTKGGDRLSAGLDGSVMGFHAHVISVDDPISPKQALSDADLRTAASFMSETIPSRKVNKAVTPTFLVMQRLHEADPTGERLASADENPVRHICLPAELSDDVKPDSVRNEYKDGLLDPVRLPRKVLDEQRSILHEHGYAGQYMQTPCLVENTLIVTMRGLMPIRRVVEGDMAFTRQGWKRVNWAGQTGTVDELASVVFSNGVIITGTPYHPIWTENRGFVAIDSLRGSDYNKVFSNDKEMTTWADHDWQRQRQLSLMGLSILGPRHEDIIRIVKEEETIYTGMCGDTTTVISPMVIVFITKTKTRVITRLRILNASIDGSMVKDMVTAVQKMWLSLPRFVSLVRHGIEQKKAKSSTENMEERYLKYTGRRQNTKHMCVPSVDVGFNLDTVKLQDIALENAKRRNELDLTKESVHGVENGLYLVNRGLPIVLDPVQHFTGGVPVYDLTIDGAHEYYANGILVHNSTRGGGMFHIDMLKYDVPPKRFKKVHRFWDKAGTFAGGAFTVGVKMGLDFDGYYWVLNVVRGQWDSHKREKVILETAQSDGRGVEIGVEQEPGSGGKDSATDTVRRLAGFNVRVHKVGASDGDKERRADPFSVQVNAGNVYMVRASWNDAYINEMRHFPMSKYMDQIDASSGCFYHLTLPNIIVGGLD